MRIEIIKNKETSLVIDDIERSIREDSILKDGYNKAIQTLKRYFEQTKDIRQKLSEVRETESQINDTLYQSPQNIIAFSGRRGTGKTSAMISFTEFLKKCGGNAKNSRLWNEEGLSEFYPLVLSPIDPTMLENDQDILSVVLSRLLYKAEERWNRNPDFFRGNQNLEQEKNELLKKANACMNGILAIKRKGEIKSLSDLQRIGDSAILKKNLFDLVDIVNRFCLGNKDIQKGSTYLVIPIDDTDCQIQKAHDVMEDIRRYLTIPNVLILMATDGDMLRNDFAQHYASEFKTGIDRGILESIDVEHYAEKYLTKLIPGTHRVYLPVFENILQGNSAALELGYYENENRDFDLISSSTSDSRDQKRRYGDCKDIDFNFQAKILNFIYQKTGLVFFEHTAYINNIIPTTMRGLAHLLNFLDSMEKVEKIEYEHNYTAPEIKEKLTKRLRSLEMNLDLFEEYFMNEWVPAKVSGDTTRILKGIEEQVPENLVQYSYDEIYRKYIDSDLRGNNDYGYNSKASYYELMELMGSINDTVEGFKLQKTYKRKLDYYNTFAVRTLLTIKNSRQILKTRLSKIGSINVDESDDRQWEFDFTDYKADGSLPKYSTEWKDGKYKVQLMPVVHLYYELLQCIAKQGKDSPSEEGNSPTTESSQLKIERLNRQSSMEKLCLQELVWVVLCNWDVQDLIYKTVRDYLPQKKKSPDELWKKINDALAARNCGMLKTFSEKGGVEIQNWPEYYSNILKVEDSNNKNKDGNKGQNGNDRKQTPVQSASQEEMSKESQSSMSEDSQDSKQVIQGKCDIIDLKLARSIHISMVHELMSELIQTLVSNNNELNQDAQNYQSEERQREWEQLCAQLPEIIKSGENNLRKLESELNSTSDSAQNQESNEELTTINPGTEKMIRGWTKEVKNWANKYDDFYERQEVEKETEKTSEET